MGRQGSAPMFSGMGVPYTVLGVGRSASQEGTRAAYRREMTNYHPDKVAHLGPELQELAKRKAQDINRAFQELAAKEH
jgi:DnaJ-domain-containing protein 1